MRRDMVWKMILAPHTRPHASAGRLLPGELGPVQVGVQSAGLEQLLMVTALDDSPFIDHQDLVSFADGRQPVGDNQ